MADLGNGQPAVLGDLDTKRPRKKTGFVVDVRRRVKPIITPDDPDMFEAVLRERAGLGPGDARPMSGPFI